MQNKIIFNGKEYNHPDDMPPDVRRIYDASIGQVNDLFEDKNRDGMPDIFENLASGNTQNMQVFSTAKVIINGQAYDNMADMPPEVRQQYQQVFEDKNQDGIPDRLENMGQVSKTSVIGKVPKTSLPPMAMRAPDGDGPNLWLLLAGGVILILLIVIVGLVFALFT